MCTTADNTTSAAIGPAQARVAHMGRRSSPRPHEGGSLVPPRRARGAMTRLNSRSSHSSRTPLKKHVMPMAVTSLWGVGRWPVAPTERPVPYRHWVNYATRGLVTRACLFYFLIIFFIFLLFYSLLPLFSVPFHYLLFFIN